MASSFRTNPDQRQARTSTPQHETQDPSQKSDQQLDYITLEEGYFQPHDPTGLNPPPPLPLRPISHEESAYYNSLDWLLQSSDSLSFRAFQLGESVPRCRQNTREEMRVFRNNTTSLQPPGKTVYPPGTRFATTAENLIDVCRTKVRGPPKKKISLSTYLRWKKEYQTRCEREGRDGEVDDDLGEDLVLTTAGKDKGKRRAGRKIWDDEEGDILDALD